MGRPALEMRKVTPEWAAPLGAFFADLRASGDDALFHPHALSDDHARVIAQHAGEDLYYVATEGDAVLGYGMLRGWDEGYAVPSLGIALGSTARGTGLARPFMHFLHAAARRRGAERVRLKVYRTNVSAVSLYRALGYEFEPSGGDQLVGFLRL